MCVRYRTYADQLEDSVLQSLVALLYGQLHQLVIDLVTHTQATIMATSRIAKEAGADSGKEESDVKDREAETSKNAVEDSDGEKKKEVVDEGKEKKEGKVEENIVECKTPTGRQMVTLLIFYIIVMFLSVS